MPGGSASSPREVPMLTSALERLASQALEQGDLALAESLAREAAQCGDRVVELRARSVLACVPR